MTTQAPTPRTDALMAEYPYMHLRPMERREERLYELSRTLERELHALRAERDALRALMLDMRQHQGAIQPYIKRMDAALTPPEKGGLSFQKGTYK
jgi:cell division protein FtsB